MQFETNGVYHVFNRSNVIVFYTRENYLFFIKKMRELLKPNADIISYCLMPNHFHIMISVKEEGTIFLQNKKMQDMQVISRAIGTLLSSYTQALNKQTGKKGSLFAHKTASKILSDSKNDYGLNCFMYIHQNPIMAELVHKIEDWEFSSFRDYIGVRQGTLVNVKLGLEIFNIDPNQIYELTYKIVQDKIDDFE